MTYNVRPSDGKRTVSGIRLSNARYKPMERVLYYALGAWRVDVIDRLTPDGNGAVVNGFHLVVTSIAGRVPQGCDEAALIAAYMSADLEHGNALIAAREHLVARRDAIHKEHGIR